MIGCAIDFESTGLDVQKDRITEIGAILFNEENPKAALEYGRLIYEPGYPELTPEIQDITGITPEELMLKGISFVSAFGGLIDLFALKGWPDVFIAHNKAYDEALFKWEMKRHKVQLFEQFNKIDVEKMFDIPWLCTIDDVKHPEKFKCRKLAHLALDYGVVVDPNVLHRAVDDVRLLVLMLTAGKMNLESMRLYASQPWVIVRAMVPKPFGPSGDGGKGKDAAKACGFGWEKPPGLFDVSWPGFWVKRIKEAEFDDTRNKLGYPITVLEKV